MSAITIDNDLVHYEVLGRGRPVILIHGWLGSWRYWIPTMQQLSVKYRIYALDLWGFGDSGKDAARYSFDSQVKLLIDFMDKLGIAKAALVGHALGAAITIEFARRCAERAPRVMLVSPPLFDLGGLNAPAVLTPPISPPAIVLTPTPAPNPITVKPSVPPAGAPAPTPAPTSSALVDKSPANTHNDETIRRNPFLDNPEALALIQGATRPATAVPAASTATTAPATEAAAPPFIPPPPPPATSAKPSGAQNPLVNLLSAAKPKALLERQMPRTDENLEKLRAEVDKMDENVLSRSAASFAGVNLALALHQLNSPVLLLHGKEDPFLPPPDEDLITRIAAGKPDGSFLPFVAPDFRHFPMLENTSKFNRLLMDFLDAPDLSNVQLKETWRRQLR